MSGSAILTNTGLLKIASASPLDQLTITDIAVGDGVNPLSPTATGLVNEVYRNTASTPIRSNLYPDTLVFELNIPPTTGGFTVREIGAFDSEGDLIAVGTLDAVTKPTDGINLTVRINVKLQNAAQVDVFYDNQGAIDHSGLRNRDTDNVHTANAIEGLEFNTVAEAVNYTKIDKLLGRRVYISERGAYFNVVLSSSFSGGNASGKDEITNSSNTDYGFKALFSDSIPLISIGGNGDGVAENLTFLDRAFELHTISGLPVDTGSKLNAFFFSGELNFPAELNLIGEGLILSSTSGTRPDENSLILAGGKAEREALLVAYYGGVINLSSATILNGSLNIENCLINPSTPYKLNVNGYVNAVNCASHNIEIEINKGAKISSSDFILTDANGIGAFIKGEWEDDTHLCMYCANDNVRMHRGGTFNAPNGVSVYSGQNGVFFWFGGFMSGKNYRAQFNERHGVVNNYNASGDFENIVCTHNTATNFVCETGGTFYAINGQFTNSVNGAGIFINGAEMNAKNATLKSNGAFAVDGRYDFYLDISNAEIDMSNNSGGVQVRSLGGDMTAIAPNTGNAINLDPEGYSPSFNSGSKTGGKIGDINPTKYKNELGGVIFKDNTSTIASGDFEITSTRQLVECESGVTDEITNVTSEIDLSFVFPSTTGATITIKHNTGNVRTTTGADIVMDSPNRGCQVVRADTLFFFVPLFS